jgi:hypothetical protein
MNCEKCLRDIGNGGVGQEDGSVLCLFCDEIGRAALEQKAGREYALIHHARYRSTSLLRRKNTPKRTGVGDDLSLLGAGLAIAGAVEDDPYAFSAGLSIQNRAEIHRSEDRLTRRIEGSKPLTQQVAPSIIRLLAERNGALDHQLIYFRRMSWVDNIECISETDGKVFGLLRFTFSRKEYDFRVDFEDKKKRWAITSLETPSPRGPEGDVTA